MKALALIRAIGGAQPAPAPPAPSLRDPMGDAVTMGLREADLWRDGCTVALTSDPARISVRVFMPERAQSDREQDRETANKVRAVIAEALRQAGCRSIFTDALWATTGGRGWSVIGTARKTGAQS